MGLTGHFCIFLLFYAWGSSLLLTQGIKWKLSITYFRSCLFFFINLKASSSIPPPISTMLVNRVNKRVFHMLVSKWFRTCKSGQSVIAALISIITNTVVPGSNTQVTKNQCTCMCTTVCLIRLIKTCLCVCLFLIYYILSGENIIKSLKIH